VLAAGRQASFGKRPARGTGVPDVPSLRPSASERWPNPAVHKPSESTRTPGVVSAGAPAATVTRTMTATVTRSMRTEAAASQVSGAASSAVRPPFRLLAVHRVIGPHDAIFGRRTDQAWAELSNECRFAWKAGSNKRCRVALPYPDEMREMGALVGKGESIWATKGQQTGRSPDELRRT
jgi:hypothetical protein